MHTSQSSKPGNMQIVEASFRIADSVYGSTIFLATGSIGAHVLISASVLLVCLYRYIHVVIFCKISRAVALSAENTTHV